MTSIAGRMFDGACAESEIETKLLDAGAEFERLTFGGYDCSLELKEVPDTYRMPPEVQKIIHDAGFAKVYVNHVNKWETHYSWETEFKAVHGWRVSYPHKRGDGTREIWVEEPVDGWPKAWFETGYVVVINEAMRRADDRP